MSRNDVSPNLNAASSSRVSVAQKIRFGDSHTTDAQAVRVPSASRPDMLVPRAGQFDMLDLSKLPFQQHPYLPSTLKLTAWQPLVLSYERILAVFFGGAAIIGLLSYLLSGTWSFLLLRDRAILSSSLLDGQVCRDS